MLILESGPDLLQLRRSDDFFSIFPYSMPPKNDLLKFSAPLVLFFRCLLLFIVNISLNYGIDYLFPPRRTSCQLYCNTDEMVVSAMIVLSFIELCLRMRE